MKQIIHDPTRGWLLLTEKWPEKQDYDDLEYGKWYNDVTACLSTAIEIAKEDWPMVDAKVRKGLGGDILHSVVQDHHPYSVDAKFENGWQWKRKGTDQWRDFDETNAHLEHTPNAPRQPYNDYRQIARLVKAKEYVPDWQNSQIIYGTNANGEKLIFINGEEWIKNNKQKETNTMNKVWVLHSGCIFEGGGLGGLFKDYITAREAALAEVVKENKWREDANTGEGDYDFDMYVETVPNYWSTNVDYIQIFEKEVL